LDDAQRLAAKVVRRVLSGAPLRVALASATQTSGADRSQVHELAYGTLRFLGQVRAIVAALAKHPLKDDSVAALLWVALYQLIHTTAPPHAVVDAAVRATGKLRRTSARGLVNAILRNFLRRRVALMSEIASDLEARFSHPRWWLERVMRDYPQHYAAILYACNGRPPLTLRVNRRMISRDDYLQRLDDAGVAARTVGDAGITLATRSIVDLPGYAEGWFSVQDAGAQLAAPLLAAGEGMRVLDACAAPGGKTMHVAELAAVQLTAIDVEPERVARLRENLSRMRLDARVITADAVAVETWWDGALFDRILLDAPCTASGVVRRHPDAKWTHRESDVDSFVGQQRQLLEALWPCLAPGGLLLYVTCSIFRAENDEQITAFAERHGDALRGDITFPGGCTSVGGQLLPAPPGAAHNHDGFFYALLRKK
jgi:16S rRNA (cytosine967-C5)-methyltransferase